MKKIPNPNKMRRIKGPKLTESQLAASKIRITTYLDKDIVNRLRELANDSGSKYQSVLNQILKDYLFGKKEGLISRIVRLEEAVFK